MGPQRWISNWVGEGVAAVGYKKNVNIINFKKVDKPKGGGGVGPSG